MDETDKDRDLKEKDSAVLPKYNSFYFSGGDKHLVSTEERRRELITKEFQHNLNARQKIPSRIRNPTSLSQFHSPLVKYGKKIASYKRQYKYIVGWFDLGSLEKPSDIIHIVDQHQHQHQQLQQQSLNSNYIYLCSYSDIVEATQTLTYLMRVKNLSTFMFIPSSKMKVVVTKLMKFQEDALKPLKSKNNTVHELPGNTAAYKYLMSVASSIQLDYNVPVVIFNPPSNININSTK